MSRDLTTTQIAAVNNRRQEFPFVWMLEVPIPDPVTPSVLRITSHSQPVVWLTDSEGGELTWTPWPLTVATINEDTKGTQQTVRVSIGNANRQIMALVDAYEGLEEQIVRIALVPLLALAEGVALIDVRGRIIGVSATNEALTFEIGQVDMRRAKFPGNRVDSTRCGYRYKDARCGYTGVLATCDKGLTTPNGCEAHANETRWGGFRGVPRS